MPGQNTAVVPAVPFADAAHEHTEPAFTFQVTPTAATQSFQFDIPSYGYFRHLWMQCVASGGVIGPGTLSADAPFNIIQSITLLDTNGAPIYGPIDGYSMFLSNLFGGYAFQQDQRSLPGYSTTPASPGFTTRVPVEISHYNGMGSLANQNAAAPYKLQIVINTIANIYGTAPTTPATFTFTGLLEAWSLPNDVDAIGRPQEVAPPNHGTVQYWSSRTQSGITAGNQTVQVQRVGNLLRGVYFVARDGTGARSNSVLPSQPILNWDSRQLYNDSQLYRQNDAYESTLSTGYPAGVYAYIFNNSQLNRSGDDSPSMWIATVQATRLELTGTFQGAGSVQVLTNDVAPVEVNPAERYVETSATGFHPNPDR